MNTFWEDCVVLHHYVIETQNDIQKRIQILREYFM